MRKIETFLNQYGESHQNPTNKLVHWICVPLIFFSIVGFLWEIKTPVHLSFLNEEPLNGGMVALLLVFIYYLTLSLPIAAGMLLFSVLCLAGHYFIAQSAWPVWLVSISIFVLAWVGQFIGHHIEGKKPSFFKDLQFLMIGPAWLMSFIFRKLGIRI